MGLIDLLPGYYKNSTQVIELQGAFEHWTDALRVAKDDLLSQINIKSATWGLSLWEKALGIETDVSKPYEFRRTRIISKLRGAGTTTKEMIQNVSESFSNGEVTIIEHTGESSFEVKFTGTIGIPPNMDDLTAAIEEIKPAHLGYSYVFIYRLHSDLSSYTHAQLSDYTHEELRSGEVT